MKQKDDVFLAFPKKPPTTIGGLARWNRHLLATCAYLEFRKRAIEAAIDKIAEETRLYVKHVTEEPIARTAKLALRELNQLRREWADDLASVKGAIRIAHDTNEAIIASLVRNTSGGEHLIKKFQSVPHPETNLLHGEGWLFEVASADILTERGYASFVTFGTMFDPGKFDCIGFPRPRTRITWKIKLPTRKNTRRKRESRDTLASPLSGR
jgi:hypothetical protein